MIQGFYRIIMSIKLLMQFTILSQYKALVNGQFFILGIKIRNSFAELLIFS